MSRRVPTRDVSPASAVDDRTRLETCRVTPPCAARRDSLRLLAGAAAGTCGLMPPALRAQEGSGPRAGDRLVLADGDGKTPVKVEDLKVNAKQVIAWPFDAAAGKARDESRLNRVLLIRLDAAQMDGPTKSRAADGVVAYSSVCTHQACEVSAYKAEQQTLVCFCHFSQFKPLEGGAVAAGPATARLAALPLKQEGGVLVVAGPFDKRPGPG